MTIKKDSSLFDHIHHPQKMDEKKEFSSLCKMKYKDQAVWMLNGFWGDCVDGNVANEVWLYVKKFVELENLGPHRRGEEGNELDQFWSAKFLEDFNSSLTAIARKEALRKIDQDNNGMMSCIEYLTWRFNRSVGDVVRAPQGDNRAALEAAQAKLDAVMRQLAECEQKIANNNQALADLKIAEGELKVWTTFLHIPCLLILICLPATVSTLACMHTLVPRS